MIKGLPLYSHLRLWILIDLGLVISLLLMFASIGYQQMTRKKAELEQDFYDRLNAAGYSLSVTLAIPVYEYDLPFIRQILYSRMAVEDIYAVAFKEKVTNLTIGFIMNARQIAPLTALPEHNDLRKFQLVIQSFPISWEQELLGQVVIYFSQSRLTQAVRLYRRGMTVLLSLIGIGSLLFANVLLWGYWFLRDQLDIGKRKLIESEHQLRLITDYLPAYVAYVKADNLRYQFVNEQYVRAFHHSREQLIGQFVWEVIGETNYQKSLPYIEKVRTGEVVSYERPFFFSDEVRWLRVSYIPDLDEQGVVKGIVVLNYDITDQKQLEEQLKQHAAQLEQAVQQKQREMEVLFERLLRQEKLATIGQMAGSIAHELRNPLGAVKQSVFYLKRLHTKGQLAASYPKVVEHLDLIETEVNTSERVISDLLQMTRLKTPYREEILLRPMLEDAIVRSHLPGRIHVQLDIVPESLQVWADPLQLRQVLLNLLANAEQAIDGEGEITIRTRSIPADNGVAIEIEDTGCGIEPEDLNQVFEPLYTTKATGTGLGLSVCKQIIENHQGQIRVRSQKGQGTTVTLLLPMQTPVSEITPA